MLTTKVYQVGQALSTLTNVDNEVLFIFDCGVGRRGENPLVNDVADLCQRYPDLGIYVILSHLDIDHISGFSELMSLPIFVQRLVRLYCNQAEYRLLATITRQLYRNRGTQKVPRVRKALDALGAIADLIEQDLKHDRRRHAEITVPSTFDEQPYPTTLRHNGPEALKISIFSPSQALRNRSSSQLRKLAHDPEFRMNIFNPEQTWSEDWNSSSIVATLEYGGHRVLLAADATKYTWKDILELLGKREPEEFLISGGVVAWHHGGTLGSLDSQIWPLIIGKEQTFVACSHGSGNSYGHPHPSTVRHVRDLGAELLCTEARVSTPDVEYMDDAFANAGMALEYGGGVAEVFQTRSCCGDITFQVQLDGEFSAHCSGRRCHGQRSFLGCCLSDADHR